MGKGLYAESLKTLKIILICFLLVFVFPGCGNHSEKGKNESIQETSQEDIQSAEEFKSGDRIEKQLTEEVKLDAVIQMPEEGLDGITLCHVEADGFDAEAYAGKFGISTPPAEWEYREAGGFEPERVYSYAGEIQAGEKSLSGHVTVGFDIRMYTDHWNSKCEMNFPIYGDSLIENTWVAYEGADITGDLLFMTMEEAAEKGTAYLAELGVENPQFLNGYSFAHEDMQAYQESQYYDQTIEDTGKPQEYRLDEWSEEDDCYWLFYEFNVNGLPLVSSPVTRQDDVYVPMGVIELGITPAGIEFLRQDVHYNVLENREEPILTIDEICKTLQEKFEMAITGEIVVDEMKLVYYPFPTQTEPSARYEYDLVPVWQFGYEENGSYNRVYINALDGVEITG